MLAGSPTLVRQLFRQCADVTVYIRSGSGREFEGPVIEETSERRSLDGRDYEFSPEPVSGPSR